MTLLLASACSGETAPTHIPIRIGRQKLLRATALASGVIATMLVFQPAPAKAQSFVPPNVWSGNINSDPTVGGNWSGGTAPTQGSGSRIQIYGYNNSPPTFGSGQYNWTELTVGLVNRPNGNEDTVTIASGAIFGNPNMGATISTIVESGRLHITDGAFFRSVGVLQGGKFVPTGGITVRETSVQGVNALDRGGTVYNYGNVGVYVYNSGSFTNYQTGTVGTIDHETSVTNYKGTVGEYNVPTTLVGWNGEKAGFFNYGTVTAKSQLLGTTSPSQERYAVKNHGYLFNGGTIENGVWNVDGHLENWASIKGMSYVSGGTLNNGGIFKANRIDGLIQVGFVTSGKMEGVTVAGLGTFENYGEVTGETRVLLGGTANNFGALKGTVTVAGGVLNNTKKTVGTENTAPNSPPVEIAGTITGDLTVSSGIVNNFTGISSSLLTVSGGSLNNEVGATIGAVTVSGGQLVNKGAINGQTTINSNGTLINKSGGSASLVNNGGTFINEAGGTVTANFENRGSTLTSANFGTLKGDLAVYSGTFTQAGKLEGSASVNAGGTLVFGGIIDNVASNGDLASNLRSTGTNFSNDGTLVFRPFDDMVVNGSIIGSGKVEIDGISGGKVTINRAYLFGNFTQDVDIKSGRLVMNALLNHNVAKFQTLNVAAGSSLTLNDDDDRIMDRYKVTGAGNFIKGGSGVLTVGSGLQNTGTVGVAGGILRFTDSLINNGLADGVVLSASNSGEINLGSQNMSIGGIQGTAGAKITGTGTLTLTTPVNAINQYSGVISGAGRNLIKDGVGTQELYGTNTYDGDTTVKAGVLKVGSTQALGTKTNAVTVESGANLELGTLGNVVLANGGSDFTFDRIITGEGGLIKTSANTVTLTAANTYTGDTYVREGTLKLGGTGKIALASKIIVSSGAKFDIGNTSFETNTLTNLGGDLVGGGGTLTLNFTTPETYSGKISDGVGLGDTFRLALTGGTLKLSGDNSFTGGIVISGHNTKLILDHNNAAGGINNKIYTQGTIINYANNVNNATQIVISSNTTQLEVNGTDSATQSGVISQDQAGRPLEKIGNGALTFSAGPGMPLINTYSGATTITGGQIWIDDTRNLGTDAASNRLIFNGGWLRSRADVTMARGVTVNATGGTVYADNNVSSLQKLVFSNGIQFNGGTLVKTGRGELHVAGTGSGTGNLTLQDGKLFLNSSAALGQASLTVSSKDTPTLSTTGNVTFANAVALNTNLIVSNVTGTSLTLSGAISGKSSLQKTNFGALNLTGNNTFSGGFTLGAGTLGVGSNTALGTANASVQTGTTLKALANVSLANNIVMTPGAHGLGNQFTVDTNGFNMTLSGVISTNVPTNENNQPGLTKNGAGNLTLTGVNTYRGATIVNAGKLIVNGSIANTSSVSIANGAVLGGNAAIPNLTIHNGATISPGNSIGTTNIAGNFVLNPGSTTIIEIQQGLSDRIIAGGTATIAGTLQLVALGGPYNFGTPYTIITATGGRTGTFATVNTDTAFGLGVTSNVIYNPNNVQVELKSQPLLGPLISRPRNVMAVAGGMDSAVSAGADPSAFFNVYNQPTRESLTAAVNTLSGEVHTGANAMAVRASDQFMRVMLDPFALGRDASLMTSAGGGFGDAAFASSKGAGETVRSGSGLDAFFAQAPVQARRFAVWGAAYGQTARGDADAITVGSSRLSASDGHLAVGADMGIAPGLVAGVAISGGQGDAKLANGMGSAKADIYQVGLYAMGRFGALSFGATGSYGSLQTQTSRSIPVLGLGSVKADYRAESWSGRVEAAYALTRLAGFGLSPTAALQAQSVRTPIFMEINGGTGLGAGVVSSGKTNATVRSELGLKFDYVALVGGADVNIYISAAWGHYYARDVKFAGSLVGLAGSAFTVEGVRPSRDVALIAAGADLKIGPNMHLGARFDTEQGSSNRSYSGSTKLRMAF